MRCRRHCVASLAAACGTNRVSLPRCLRCFRRTALDHTGRGRRPLPPPPSAGAPAEEYTRSSRHTLPSFLARRCATAVASVARTAAAPRGGRRSARSRRRSRAAAAASPRHATPGLPQARAAAAPRGVADGALFWRRRGRSPRAAPRPRRPAERSAPRRPWPLWRLSARTASAAARRPCPPPPIPPRGGGHRPSTTATERHPNSTWPRACLATLHKKVGRWTIPSRFSHRTGGPPPYGDGDVRNASMKTPPLSTLCLPPSVPRARGALGAERLTDSSAAGRGARLARLGPESRRDECAQPLCSALVRSCVSMCVCVCATVTPRTCRCVHTRVAGC